MIVEPGFSTEEMTRIFSAQARVELFCRFESELAAAQAKLGIVPAQVAEKIAAACSAGGSPAQDLLAAGWEVGTPVTPLLEQLGSRLDAESAGWLHHGATTQDVVDTAQVLQMKSGLVAIESRLIAVSGVLARLADTHRQTVMMGRTFLQSAVPTTFGVKAALWLEPLLRHQVDLKETAAGLPIQLGGPVGDAGSFGEQGPELAADLAGRLALAVPAAPWHTDRSPITETVALVGRVAASMAKIATDLALLAQSGIEEIRVRSGGSSSMPHKRNPIDAVRAAAAAEVCRAMVAGVLSSPPHERERSLGSWHAESAMVPVVFETAAAAVEAIERCLDSLEVDQERMAANAGTESVVDVGLIDRVLKAYRGMER